MVLFIVTAIIGVGRLAANKTVRTAVVSRISGDWEPAKAFPGRNEVTLLVMGRDVDRDHHGQIINSNARTDAIMLMKLDFAKHTANLLSIPRDTIVDIPGHGRHKINAAHAYGGPELAVETVSAFLDVQPDYYVTFNYEAFEKAIDQMGGLYVSVPKQLDYDDNWGNLHIHLQPGPQKLTGYQAMGFVRFRHSNTGIADTDFERIARQQQFMLAIKSQMKSARMFVQLPNIIDTIRSGINSPMSDPQMMAVANFMRGLPKDSVHMATLPNEPGRSHEAANMAEAEKLVDEMFKS